MTSLRGAFGSTMIAFVSVASIVAIACGNDSSEFGNGSGNDGGSGNNGAFESPDGSTQLDGAITPIGDGGCGPNLTGILRDFRPASAGPAYADFEAFISSDLEIVTDLLGSDEKPIYKSKTKSPTTTGKENFDRWFRDSPGVNQSFSFTLEMKEKDGIYTYDNPNFFPLDGKGFGNEMPAPNDGHNFHFTYELHTEFVYSGGEVFTFIGDDDLFTYINGHLAINLGGVHGAQTGTIKLDEKAAALGIEKGKTYRMAVFQAERHTSHSNFRVDTTIKFTNCGPLIF